jgi:hypothetical protein
MAMGIFHTWDIGGRYHGVAAFSFFFAKVVDREISSRTPGRGENRAYQKSNVFPAYLNTLMYRLDVIH